MIIALTNDDGIHAPGIRAMYAALRKAGHTVFAIAPLGEQSAVGHAITVMNPLRVKQCKEHDFEGLAVLGTPADCIKLGVGSLLPRKPDLVVSGINAGANVGPDILYSGTVAAATEAAHMGYPSIAVSCDSFHSKNLEKQAEFTVEVIHKIPWKSILPRRIMNLNLPPDMSSLAFKGLKVCPQTSAVWQDWYDRREDPRGIPYWWLTGLIPPEKVHFGTDKDLLSQGWATLTPLRFDFTDRETMHDLKNIFPDE